MELARGSVGDDRPWALTFATFARRGTSGQITIIASDGKRYSVALDRGLVIGARSPAIADTVGRIALTTRIAKSDQVTELARQLQTAPHRDEIELLAELANLAPAQVARLRWEVTARRAARAFDAEQGEWLLEDTICLPPGGCEVDARAVIYQGLRLHAREDVLRCQLRKLGDVFQLESDAGPELHRFGFTDNEWPLLAALRTPTTVPELEVKVPDIDSRTLQSAIYSLVACGLASTPTIGRIPTPPQVARLGTDSHVQTPSVSRLGTPHYPEGIAIARLGTKQPAKPAVFTIGNAGALSPSRVTPMPFRTPLPPGVPALPTVPRTKTNPELAGEAAERAKRALAQDKPEAAVLELKKAVELVPNDPDYTALLGWALFCAADDKRAAATIARKALESAIAKSRQPQIARFYLGRIERILGHNEEALGHFHAVLLMQPDHREASAEIRVLQARLKRS